MTKDLFPVYNLAGQCKMILSTGADTMTNEQHLRSYIESRNALLAFFRGSHPIDPDNISYQDARDLLEAVECDLSPENLCCDGELRGRALQQKAARLHGAKAALEELV